MESAVVLYEEEYSLRSIADELTLNPIKVRKLLITAGVYESEVAEKVQDTFEEYRETENYKEAILSTANTLQLSKASVTSYLPYQKGVYFPSTADKEKISVGAERRRRYRAVRKLRSEPTEEHLWETVLLYSGVRFKTYSGLPFTYEIRKGRSGEYYRWREQYDCGENKVNTGDLLCFARDGRGAVVCQTKDIIGTGMVEAGKLDQHLGGDVPLAGLVIGVADLRTF